MLMQIIVWSICIIESCDRNTDNDNRLIIIKSITNSNIYITDTISSSAQTFLSKNETTGAGRLNLKNSKTTVQI